ncbi:transcriptional regulator [Longilinea arvoryzae]|uniref:Transcriptional regulator n=1 Tax=Longilinea arvoryzae TaxID=360412 RepID=A0A0S7BE17_9CHLR|nr:substrate-binding domain-containing protein [Longilinea arvoryzae]GAP13136.1 transcriptional regulator [Longilinea arvoryzae]
MTSIRDVAKLAGVSTATVSHILNGTRFVTDETRKKVMDAIDELDYYPSKVAQGLARNKSQTIGIVFSDIANPHFTQIFKGIEKFFSDQGYDLILANTSENPRTQETVLASMLARGVDGLIMAPSAQPSERLRNLKERGLPIVLVDRGDSEIDLPLVGVNNPLAAYQAACHLIGDGHNRIGLILGLKNISTTGERLAGFSQAYAENNIPRDPDLVYWGDSSLESGYQGAMALLRSKSHPTAIFCTNNLMTMGALHAIRECGLDCPHDIGVVGFDDHFWADIFTPPLTVVAQPTFEIGRVASELLHGYIVDGIPAGTPPRINLDANLIVRGSCSLNCYQQYITRR